ncbi:MAG: DUF4476 domain-containing protein [Bdellovibrionota bacterium]
MLKTQWLFALILTLGAISFSGCETRQEDSLAPKSYKAVARTVSVSFSEETIAAVALRAKVHKVHLIESGSGFTLSMQVLAPDNASLRRYTKSVAQRIEESIDANLSKHDDVALSIPGISCDAVTDQEGEFKIVRSPCLEVLTLAVPVREFNTAFFLNGSQIDLSDLIQAIQERPFKADQFKAAKDYLASHTNEKIFLDSKQMRRLLSAMKFDEPKLNALRLFRNQLLIPVDLEVLEESFTFSHYKKQIKEATSVDEDMTL